MPGPLRTWSAAMFLLLATLICLPAKADERRVALVVGIGAYQAVPALRNTRHDAREVSAALSRLGFMVNTVLDPTRTALESAVRQLGVQARGADAALVFYAGHALEVGGRNWLLPTSADPATERDLRFEAVDLDSLLEQLDGMARVSIVLLDSCRDNPFRLRFAAASRGVSPSVGLAPPRAPVGTLVAFATAPGMTALDGSGEHSPFTTALLARMETPGLEFRALMAQVRRAVREATAGQQVSWEHSALEGDFYLKPAAAVAVQPTPTPAGGALDNTQGRNAGSETELLFWQSVRESADLADLRAYLARFPTGVFADLARNRLAKLGGTAPAQATLKPSAAPDAKLQQRLVEALSKAGDLKAAPYAIEWHRTEARAYDASPGPKAMAVEPDAGRSWRWWGSPSNTPVEQLVLEGCQQAFGKPCVLLASGSDIRAPDPRIAQRSPMPRIAYGGPFRIDMVPLTRPDALPDAVKAYAAMPGPKALAMRPVGVRFSAATGATVIAAETAALATCNMDTSLYPCVLYASGDRVVLPQRRTEAGSMP